ncbi:hypothetical protein JY75_10165 [Neisseria meningitidis]|nr:hypothetical protein JY21_04555 [Neisseria meningitidis]RPC94048.1 hypothetical protein JY73_10175 [Neisseria meningitidis]RPC97824.1 hypothetical protein JY75_10165 [Neisseria meningitidis]RPD19249.1 hypothetical protein JY86_10290 [Neisseria meningitidis]
MHGIWQQMVASLIQKNVLHVVKMYMVIPITRRNVIQKMVGMEVIIHHGVTVNIVLIVRSN